MELLVVRRGMSADYYKYLHMAARANGTEFLIDRRGIDRRHESFSLEEDRRSRDRRGHPPDTWARDAFVSIQRPPR
jgi:hypothetical protein